MKNSELMTHEGLKKYCKTLEEGILLATNRRSKAEKQLTAVVNQREIQERQLREIRHWFNKHGHQMVEGEGFIEKLDNLQAIIDGLKTLLRANKVQIINSLVFEKAIENQDCKACCHYERDDVCETCKQKSLFLALEYEHYNVFQQRVEEDVSP